MGSTRCLCLGRAKTCGPCSRLLLWQAHHVYSSARFGWTFTIAQCRSGKLLCCSRSCCHCRNRDYRIQPARGSRIFGTSGKATGTKDPYSNSSGSAAEARFRYVIGKQMQIDGSIGLGASGGGRENSVIGILGTQIGVVNRRSILSIASLVQSCAFFARRRASSCRSSLERSSRLMNVFLASALDRISSSSFK